MKIFNALKIHWPKFLSILLFILLIGAYSQIFAIGQSYDPGETLDPECPPGEVNCTVEVFSASLLSGYVPYTGAGSNLELGSQSLIFGTYSLSPTYGRFFYNPNSGGSMRYGGSTLYFDTKFDIHEFYLSDGTGDKLDITNYGGMGLYDADFTLSYSGNISLRPQLIDSTHYADIGMPAYNWGNIFLSDKIQFFDDHKATYPRFTIKRDGRALSIYGENNLLLQSESGSGNVGIGITSPEAVLHIKGGTNISNTAPLKFTAGTNLTTPEEGAVEWDGINLFVTQTLGPTRKTLAYTTDIVNSPITIVNTSNLFSTGLTGSGNGVTEINDSIFLGTSSGSGATGASYSNFLGLDSGNQATDAYNSNFFGYRSGYQATNAINSNFFGPRAGSGSASASYSNFLGLDAGYQATNASYSNFLGLYAGTSAGEATQSNFFGNRAGYGATNASYSNFFGRWAGWLASDATQSNFLGYAAGRDATSASNSNFFGYQSGQGAISSQNSNFLGYAAGRDATSASNSNFFGSSAGDNANLASNSNFFGPNAGKNATGANNANFFGSSAGYQAENAVNSNFIGSNAGNTATFASNSNFIGWLSGHSSTYGVDSNFIGKNSGYAATYAYSSNFIGSNAGDSAVNASNSIFIGSNSGNGDTVNNTNDADDFSILIGKSTSTGGFSNSIALGGSAVNTDNNEFMIGSTTRPINTTIFRGAANECTITTGTGIACTSDERLKDNITDLSNDTLDKLLQVKTINFNWKDGDLNTNNIGFIAQDLEKYFPELVSTNESGFKSVYYANMAPIIVEAIREMDLKVKNINEFEIENDWRDNIIAWVGNTANGISEFVAGIVRAKEKLCIGEGEDEVCITKEELLQIKINSKIEEENKIILPDPIISVDTTEEKKEVEEKTGDETVDSSTEDQKESVEELIKKEDGLIDELSVDQNNQKDEVEEEPSGPVESESILDTIN